MTPLHASCRVTTSRYTTLTPPNSISHEPHVGIHHHTMPTDAAGPPSTDPPSIDELLTTIPGIRPVGRRLRP
jgi:hypothetical protein